MKLTEDDNLEESFETAQQAITPQASIGGMGEVSFPDGDTLGSGDVPSVADIDDDEEEAKKDKTKKKLEMEALHLTFDSFLNELNINEGNFEGVADLVKALHFELDPKTAEEMKIELGKRQGELVVRTQIEGGNYSLKRFRKEIKYGSDNKNIDLGVFVPGTYTAAVSTLGDGPHAKAAKKIKWNQKKYDQWLEDVASNDGWKNASDMAQNANNEPGLIAWVKKNNRGEDAMQRIQWDIEAFAESVVIESKNSKEIKELEKLLKSIKSNTPADQGRKASIQDDIERLKNESVVTEAKNTIGLAFKEEQDYLDFKEFVAEQPRGAIRKNIGFDSKTKSWNVEMDVKVLDSIYGEGTPSDKKSGWYGGLPDDFESVIIESVNEAISPKSFTIFQIATPAPQSMLVAELRGLFNDKQIKTNFKDDERFESVVMFNLTKSDIKKIEDNIGDVLIWEYSLGKRKSII